MSNKLKLINGLEISNIGLGAEIIEYDNLEKFENEYEFYCYTLESGICDLYDTSAAYSRNDEALGKAIRDTHMRKNISIMTKISNSQQRDGNIRYSFEKHLQYLQTDYVDIYLLHWPQTGTFIKTYLEMEKLYEEGLVKAIGVCNCNIHHINELMSVASIRPMINQIEITPIFTQTALVNYCKAYDILPVAYSPLARMHDVLIKSRPIHELAKKYKKTEAQIIMKWNELNERTAIVRTRNKSHFAELFNDISDFTLSDKEVYWINSLDDNIRLRYNSDTADFLRL